MKDEGWRIEDGEWMIGNKGWRMVDKDWRCGGWRMDDG